MRTVLGVDLGTSGMKAVAVAEDGAVLAEVETSYEVEHPQPGWAEIDPQRWVTATTEALRRLLAEAPGMEPVALAFDGQMHGVVLVDEAGDAVRPAVLWPDRRAETVLPRWRALPADQRARLANPITPGMAGPILDWLAQHEPDPVAAAAAALQPKDFVRLQLGGSPVGDRSDASATLLWDVPADDWARDIVTDLGLPARLLPEIRASGAPDGQLRSAGTSGRGTLGPPGTGGPGSPDLRDLPDLPLVVGAGDTPAALLAAGGLRPGEVQLNLGSGAQVLMGLDRPAPQADPVTHVYATADFDRTQAPISSGSAAAATTASASPSAWGASERSANPALRQAQGSLVAARGSKGWYAMAAIQNAGLALGRMRRWLGLAWEQFYAAAAQAPPGAGGVSIHPFLTGERGGVAAPDSRGAWLGLSETTTRDDIARAAVEGVVFSVRRGLGLLDARPGTIRLTGGGGRNPLVAQLLADVTGAGIARVPDRSASARGAAMLAGQAHGVTIPPLRPTGPRYEPVPAAALEEAYERWLAPLR